MIRAFLGLTMASFALLSTASEASPKQVAVSDAVIGTWVNPHGSVKVRTGICAPGQSDSLCGWIVWTAPQADADARDAGVNRLIGTELLRSYHPAGQNRYRGEVYVPDLGRSFVSTIEQRGANDLKISGCILGGLVCKSQDWRRI